jgi:molybdopterin-guanine dinucleotide biosynthesis protein A
VVRDRPGVVGALLVGGASRRFGSPKALARYEGEMLAERAHRVLAEAFGEVLVVGKSADGLELPFEVLDDGSDVRAAIVGLAAAIRHAEAEVVVVLPTDMPLVTAELLRGLGEAAEGVDAAVPQTGALPGAYRRTALPVLERQIAMGELALHAAIAQLAARVVPCDVRLLVNVNRPADLGPK